MSIKYQIKPVNPNAHLYQVTLSVSRPMESGQVFNLPNWIPGSYMIRDFAKNIVTIRAFSGGEKVQLEKLCKSRWRAAAVKGELELVYEIYAWDLSVRAAHLDNSHGFFNGTSVFLCVEGWEEEPVGIEIQPPGGNSYLNWRLASSLSPVDVDGRGFGHYKAQNYDELIDHPVEMGEFTRVEFDACGVAHEVVLTGRFDADLDRLCRDLKTICEYHIRFFEEPAPMEKYVFLVMVVAQGYGGLEHRASTSLLVSRKHLPAKGAKDLSDDYLEFLGLCSHEYFHTWNVKRIKPAVFVPYRLERETHTTLLWAFEGITSYYDDLALARCGLIDRERYLKLLGKMLTRVYRGRGRLKQSLADSSFDAWTKFYKQDENAPNAIVSYYAKGAIVALLLDCVMRDRSTGKASLDDLMKRLWKNWLSNGKGVTESEIETLAAELTGHCLNDFLDQSIRGTEDPLLEEYLSVLGIMPNWRAAVSPNDPGGDAGNNNESPTATGMRYKSHPKGFEVTHVFDGGAAQICGLSAGDIVVAVDEYAVDPAGFEDYLKRHGEGYSLLIHFFRHGELRHVEMVLQAAPTDTCYLTLIKGIEERCDHWLKPSQATV